MRFVRNRALSGELRRRIVDEIAAALGRSRHGAVRAIVAALLYLPTRRFGDIAARFEEEAARAGLPAASRRVLPDFGVSACAEGAESVPATGPLLVVANHPGAYDSIAIASCIPRNDLVIAVSDVPFTRALRASTRYFVFVPFGASVGALRASALRSCIRHVRSGGALLLFPHGDVEPDPVSMKGAAASIREWSRSAEVILASARGARFVVAIASGVLSRAAERCPLVRIRASPAARQKLSEFLEVSARLLRRPSRLRRIDISFSAPLAAPPARGEGAMELIRGRALSTLSAHLARTAPSTPSSRA